jgi:predicted transcriptional regulator YdeE
MRLMSQSQCHKAWGEIWKMDLDRSFTGDFEEYLTGDVENCDIDIYIALK